MVTVIGNLQIFVNFVFDISEGRRYFLFLVALGYCEVISHCGGSEETQEVVHRGGLPSGLEEQKVILVQRGYEAVLSLGDVLLSRLYVLLAEVGTLVTAPPPQLRVVQHQPPGVLSLTEVSPTHLCQQTQLPFLLLGLSQLFHLKNKFDK